MRGLTASGANNSSSFVRYVFLPAKDCCKCLKCAGNILYCVNDVEWCGQMGLDEGMREYELVELLEKHLGSVNNVIDVLIRRQTDMQADMV